MRAPQAAAETQAALEAAQQTAKEREAAATAMAAEREAGARALQAEVRGGPGPCLSAGMPDFFD